MIVTEIAVWLGRIVGLLPNIIRLWTAAREEDSKAQLEESLQLIRAMKDLQAREEIGAK